MKFDQFARYLLIVWSLTTVLASVALGKQANVTLSDGRVLSGELVSETTQAITLRIAGINTPITRDQIKDIQYIQSISEQYAQRRAKLAADDIEGRYELARWLFDQKAYDMAKKELTELQATAPDHKQAKLLLRVVEERIKLSSQPAVEPDKTTPAADPTAKIPATQTTGPRLSDDVLAKLPRLSEEQISLIRLYEIDLSARPRVIVPREVIETVLKDYAEKPGVPKGKSNQDAFRAAPGYEQLYTIISIGADALYPRVIVRDDPPAMRDFRTKIHQNFVLSYCATAQCHGGPNSGKIFLFPDRANDEATVYTNFLILNNYSDETGYMIDRGGNVEDSLLIQHAMPRTVAKYPHPDVAGWRSLINTDRDPRYKMIADWMRELNPRRKTYPINYKAPMFPIAKHAQTQPAPATQPK